MRDILFRGKRLDNGEWVEAGTILRTNDEEPICWMPGRGEKFRTGEDAYGNILSMELKSAIYRVDPATVGQYTGLTDKNGKRIFEGDIFEWGYAGVKDFRYVIVYDAELASFVGERHFGFVSLNGIDIEIIGNIHDNPELVKGEGSHA